MSIACVKIPHLPLQCEVNRSPKLRGEPVIVYHGAETRPVVLDASRAARVPRGTALSRALLQHPDALTICADEARYDRRWQTVIKRLLDISDRVEDTARGTAFVVVDGLDALYGGRQATLARIAAATAASGFVARVGSAPGRFPAYCAAIRARPAEPLTLPDRRDEIREFLSPLPIDVLPLNPRAVELLHDFALDTMGDLAAQSLSALQAQLGPEGKRAWELVNGIDRTRLDPVVHTPKIVDALRFPWPVASMDALSFGVRTLLERAFAAVSRSGKAVGRMDLTCEMSNAERWDYSHVFKEPTDSAIVAHGVVMTQVEAMVQSDASPIRSPVEIMNAELSRLGPGRVEQFALWSDEPDRGDLDTALRQLSAKLPASPMKTVVDVEPWSRIPERRQALTRLISR